MSTRQTSLTAALTFIVGSVLAALGADASATLSASIACLIVCAVSYLSPREFGISRPAGVTAAAATVLVWVLDLRGVTLDMQTAIALVTVPASIIGAALPQQEPIPGELEELPRP